MASWTLSDGVYALLQHLGGVESGCGEVWEMEELVLSGREKPEQKSSSQASGSSFVFAVFGLALWSVRIRNLISRFAANANIPSRSDSSLDAAIETESPTQSTSY